MSILMVFLLWLGWQVGGVSGVVVDQSGAVIPGAEVVFSPVDHHLAAVSAKSAGDGGFRFAVQEAGSYRVCVQAPAFEQTCVENLPVGTDGVELGRVVLKVGSMSSPIAVEGSNGVDAGSAHTGRALGQAGGAGSRGQAAAGPKAATKDDLLRGGYGEYRANNDLLSYALDVRVDPVAKSIAGKNTVRFRMLADGRRIQLDLVQALAVDRIMRVDEGGRAVGAPLKFTRDERAVFVDFPETLTKGRVVAIDFYYSGKPVEGGRFGGLSFKTDPAGRAWVTTACEGEGASVWWPNKDQWRDEVEAMDIRIAVPNGLMDVSNGRFVGKTNLGDGYTRWDWHVSYPINNYDVALNIGDYVHFGGTHKGVALDYYVLPENLEKAKVQFAQVPAMLDAYEHYFGEYPFARDGYKLVEVPYSGMEHQSAVAYGNGWENGYLHRDWTGVGISPRFDFIVIHESGHEWFGNAVTAADRADMWIHEGWTTYMECLYVEYMWGHADEVAYVNALKKKVRNELPIIPARGENREPPQDMYFKGALFLNTLRSVVEDDAKWFAMIREFCQEFKHRTIATEDVVEFFSGRMGMDVRPIFDEYLRHAALPVLEVKFGGGVAGYRWKSSEAGFRMPLRVGERVIVPGAEWQEVKAGWGMRELKEMERGYYVEAEVVGAGEGTTPGQTIMPSGLGHPVEGAQILRG